MSPCGMEDLEGAIHDFKKDLQKQLILLMIM